MNQDYLHDMKVTCVFTESSFVIVEQLLVKPWPMIIHVHPEESSHSMSPIKWRAFAMLPRQKFHRGVFMATRIGKLKRNWNNVSAICMSNTLDLFPEWLSIMTALFSERISCLWCFWFDDLFYTHQLLCMIERWKTSICQCLNFPLSLASGSSKTRRVSQKLSDPLDSMFALEVYLHLYIGNSCIVLRLLWNFFLWSIFTFSVKSFGT